MTPERMKFLLDEATHRPLDLGEKGEIEREIRRLWAAGDETIRRAESYQADLLRAQEMGDLYDGSAFAVDANVYIIVKALLIALKDVRAIIEPLRDKTGGRTI